MIRLLTRNGTLTLGTAAPNLGHPCGACHQDAALEVDVTIAGRPGPVRVAVCGDCVAEALAIHFGREHVQRGGRVQEFARPDHGGHPEPPWLGDGGHWTPGEDGNDPERAPTCEHRIPIGDDCDDCDADWKDHVARFPRDDQS